ncbi:MAG: HesA/MoeB/ThiF family protein [Terriglobales bacterium]
MNSDVPPIITEEEYLEQYRDQIAVIGAEAQLRLRQSSVHVAGLGGIGAHVVTQLAEAGVGHITANDPQRLELSNLSRWPIGDMTNVGVPKVDVLQSFLRYHGGIRFEAVQECSEAKSVAPMLRAADLIICCSNTVPSKVAAVQAAMDSRRPLLDVAVADGRRALSGAIRVFNPLFTRHACPACFATLPRNITRDEGLLSTVIGSTAAVAAHVAVSILVAGSCPNLGEFANLIVLDFNHLDIERCRIVKRDDCPVCKRRC